jgi:penicillin G amidase
MKNSLVLISTLLCFCLMMGVAWSAANVTRDKYGIPTITADSEEELFESFGYVTAVDRLWQLENNRRFSRGRLAEIFGPKLVPLDMDTRVKGYTEADYQAMFDKLPPDVKKKYEAYVKGINRRVDDVLADPRLTPFEFLAIKLKPSHFKPTDTLCFIQAFFWRFGTMGGGELENLAALETLTKRFGRADGWAVFNDWSPVNDPSAPTYSKPNTGKGFVPGGGVAFAGPTGLDDDRISIFSAQAELLDRTTFDQALKVGAPVRMGSFAWALSPQTTGTGYPILVGQPQMGFSVPTTTMEVTLRGGDIHASGISPPLFPTVAIGYNKYAAWSLMNGMSDNYDVYQEVLNPLNREEYLHKGQWRKMTKRTEKILIAGGKSKEITIYGTVHGPVFQPFPFDPKTVKGDRVYTRKLAHWQKDYSMAMAGVGMMKAGSPD